jgi:hypothetical protein
MIYCTAGGWIVEIMIRQSVSLTEPNDEWLKSQIENKEYSSKGILENHQKTAKFCLKIRNYNNESEKILPPGIVIVNTPHTFSVLQMFKNLKFMKIPVIILIHTKILF